MPPIGNRVLVIGCSGAGKTVFARRLALATGRPLIHLDQEYWQPGWTPPDEGWWRSRVDELIARPNWIMDGNFLGSLPRRLERADTVVLFDSPRGVCLCQALTRIARNFGRTRADMAAGCPERLDWAFLKYIWNFHRNHRPRVLKALEGFPGSPIVFRSTAEANAFLDDRRA